MKPKSFNLKRFGFKFKMFIKNEVVTACIVRVPGDNHDRSPIAFVGIAKVNKPDVYNYEIGKRIAIKSAINKYSSYKIGKEIQAINGFRSQMSQFNYQLQFELNALRAEK